ncbi:serine protease [Mycobacterium sp. NPDC050853]|uniref:serine protease n=1 Tax=Mycobacteriaceae TaxID=1762 RepID=UPI0015DDEF42|nr:serine protease [Mycobacteroides sp. LB1]
MRSLGRRTGYGLPVLMALFGLVTGAIPAVAAPAAGADDKVPMGGGAGLIINGDTLCTLTTIGHDNKGNLVGFTSAHCGGAGSQVVSEDFPKKGVLGKFVNGNEQYDYATIQFDPAKVEPVSTYKGFAITGIGPDPQPGDIACKLGRTTGNSCGVTFGAGAEPGTFINQVCGQPGDSGAPVTVNGQLVGMIHGAATKLPVCIVKYIPLHTPTTTYSINTVLADINAKNRTAGVGYTPVG